MEQYLYHCLMRPAGPGAVPRSGWVDSSFDEGVSPSGHHTWEIRDYELEEEKQYE